MDHQQINRKQTTNSSEVALANEVFDQFCNASTLKSILGYYRHLCELLKIRPNVINQFYPKLKAKLRSWKAQALWKKFDQRASHKCYTRGKACPNARVLIIGGGPCGLRSAIEAQLLGTKVVVVEKRDRMSRNNVLHLWPFVIQDLRSLGAKKFFGKFCAGSIDHISIRQLQCILLKVALILGVEFHENVSFDSLIPPSNQEDGKIGWRAKTVPTDHPVSQYEFDVLIGADGKRNTLEGFKRKEFRGKLAIAITANFINKRTEAEARVEEISGVAFIFNQKFFKELYQGTGIDLENIVYYKDDTHYFVMTAKKHSLIDKGVILQDHADTAKLLAKENVDREALMLYAREAAEFSTEYQMTDLEFAVNHYGQPDVAMFDFTSMYAAENASRILERHGHRLLMILVGDSLLEPFWPTGSGCARGFLSSLDAGWAIKGWGSSLSPLEVIAERESIYRLLGQTTPENLNRDYAAYTLDPHTRYPNLNVRAVTPIQVCSLLDTDNPESIKQPTLEIDIPKKKRRRDLRTDQIHPDTLLRWLQKQVALYDNVHIEDMGASFKNGLAICAIIHRYRPDVIDFYNLNAGDIVKNNQLAFDILEKELDVKAIMTGEEMAQCDVPDKLAMFSYLTQIYEAFRGEIPYVKHPKLEQVMDEDVMHPKQQLMESKVTRARRSSRHTSDNAQCFTERRGDVPSRRSRKRRSTEKMTMDRESKIHLSYRKGSMDEEFSGRIKDFEDKLKGTTSSEKKPKDLLRAIGKIEKTDWNVKEIEKKIEENKMGRSMRHDRVERVPKWSREQFLARQIKMEKRGNDQRDTYSKYADIDNTLKSIGKKIQEGSVFGCNKVSAMAEQFSSKSMDTEPKIQKSKIKPAIVLPAQGGSEVCHFCNKRVYLMERLSAEGKFFHRGCFRCEYCSISLRIGNHTFDREKNGGRFYCTQHFGLLGTMKTRAEKKIYLGNKENEPNTAITLRTPEKSKISLEGVAGLDLLDRGQTPERIEFENLAGVLDPEEGHSQMDEDEWTDRNFGASTAELGSSDDISDMSDSDEDNEVFEEAIDQPLTTEGTLELAKNWTLRYSHPHGTIGQSDTGSNEYEESSDDYTSEDDESDTATEDEEDVRARELRKQEVWLKMPLRNSDTDTGSETEVKNFLAPIDVITAQESSIPSDPEIISLITDTSQNLSDGQNREKPPETTLSEDIALISNDLTMNLFCQANFVTSDNDASPNAITQTSESIIHTAGSTDSLISSIDYNTLKQNELLISPSNFTVNDNNYDNLTEDSSNSDVESFDKCIWLDLSDPEDNVGPDDSLQNEIIDDEIVDFNLSPTDSSKSASNFGNIDGSTINCTLTSPVVHQSRNYTKNDRDSSKQMEETVLPNITPSIGAANSCIIFNSENNLTIDKLTNLVTQLNNSEDSLSSSSSDIYRSTEILYSDSVTSNSMNNSIKFSDTDLLMETERCKYEASSLINKDEDFIIDKHEDIELINGSNNIHMSDITDKKTNRNTLTVVTSNVQRVSVCPVVTVTSPSPTQEKQFEKLPVQTSNLSPLQNFYVASNLVDDDDPFYKLKQDLKQRKARNKIVEKELKPLSTENARLKMSKYFTKSRNLVPQNRLILNKEIEEESKVEVMKLDITPKLSNKINTEKILKYFNNFNSSNVNERNETDSIIETTDKQNDNHKLGTEVENINDIDEEDDAIDKEFNQIEKRSSLLCPMKNNGIGSQSNLPIEVDNSKNETEYTLTCDNLDLVDIDFTELCSEFNVDKKYADVSTLNHNIPKLNDNDSNISSSNTELGNNILKLQSLNASNTSVLFIDQNNTQVDITNKEQHKEKEINIESSNNVLESHLTKEDVVKVNSQNNSLYSSNKNEQKFELNNSNNIITDLSNVDKNKKFNRSLSFEGNIHLIKELSFFLPLKDNAIKNNMLHETYMILSKSDMNINKSARLISHKNVNKNSKSLYELRHLVFETVPAMKIMDSEKIIDTFDAIQNANIANKTSTQKCIQEVSTNETVKKCLYSDVSPKSYAKEAFKLMKSSSTDSTLLEASVRKETIREEINLLNQNHDSENATKLQNSFVQDINKVCSLANNNVSNIQGEDIKKCQNTECHLTKASKSTESSYTESILPEVPVRKKTTKERVNLLNQNHDSENTSKPQNLIIQDINKIYSPDNNDVSNIQNEDIEKCKNTECHLMKASKSTESSYTEPTLPEVPVRKKTTKERVNLLNQNYDVESILKLQNANVKDVEKICSPVSNDISNTQNQDMAKHQDKKCHSTEVSKSTEISYTESTLPEVPIRKKTTKERVNLLNKNYDIDSTSKLQNPIVQDIKKICSSVNNDISNTQNQDLAKHANITSQNDKKREQNRDIKNVSKLQNDDIKNVLKQSSQNLTKLHATCHGGFVNEAKEIKDDKVVLETQNCDVIKVLKTPVKEESVKSVFSNKQKDKCVVS